MFFEFGKTPGVSEMRKIDADLLSQRQEKLMFDKTSSKNSPKIMIFQTQDLFFENYINV